MKEEKVLDGVSFAIGYNQGKNSAPVIETQEKEVTVTENGTTEVTPDEGKLLSRVIVETEVTDGYFATEENEAGGLTYEISANMVEGGGAKLNIHCSADTPPTDTSKLWVKTETEPSGVIVSSDTEVSEGVVGDKEKLTAAGTLSIGNVKIMASAGVGDKVYLFGCNDDTYHWTHLFLYDTKTGQIEGIERSLNTGIRWSAPAVVGTKAYLFGGYGKNTFDNYYYYSSYVAIYDTEKNYISSSSLPSGVHHMTAAVIENVVYLFGGRTADGKLDTILCFDTDSNSVATLTEKLPVAVDSMNSAVVGKKVYLFGGNSDNGVLDTILCFDSETNKVDQLSATLPYPQYDIGVGAIGRRVYLFGGYQDGNATNTIHCFDTETEKIEQLPIELAYRTTKEMSQIATTEDIAYLFGGKIGNLTSEDIYKFEALSMLLAENVIQIYPASGTNMFRIVNTPTVRLEIGVESVFKGNAENVGERVEAAIYRDGEWQTI